MPRAILKLTLLIFGFCLLVTSAEANAAEIDEAGAARLKAVMQKFLERQDERVAGMNSRNEKRTITLAREGELVVEPADQYYAVTLPPTTVHFTAKDSADETESADAAEAVEPVTTEKESGSFRIGMISINARPAGLEGQWNMTIAIPSPVFIIAMDGAEKVRVNIGEQKSAGVWSEALNDFIKLDSLYKNISLNVASGETVAKIWEFSHVIDFAADAQERLSGDTKTVLNGLSITPPKSAAYFTLDRVELSSEAMNVNMAARKNLEAMKTADGEAMDYAWIAAEFMDMADSLSFTLKFDGMESSKPKNEDLKKILITQMDETANTQTQSLKIDQGVLGLALSGLRQETASAKISAGYIGLENDSAGEIDEALAPEVVEFRLEPREIPVKKIAAMITNDIEVNGQITPLSVMFKLPALLAAAGTSLDINTRMANDMYEIKTSGAIKADIVSANGMDVDLTTTIANLEGIINHAQSMAAQEDAEKAEPYAKLLTTLNTLKEVGVVSAPPEGEAENEMSVHSYHLSMTDAGELVLNGQPAMPLLQKLEMPEGLF